MLAPLSWIKDYVDTKLDPKTLGDRLTEVGLGTEKIQRGETDVIFEFDITPNRPDLLSIIGIAREIAAIEDKKIKYPKAISLSKKPAKFLPLKIETDYKINPRFTSIIIDNVKIGKSPDWLIGRLIKIGQRPINNIVDITNYVMFELGNPIHAFDYSKIKGKVMRVERAKGGERFESVDGISYILPKGAVIIKDSEKIIDLCGIKGGRNTATLEGTKTIVLRAPVEKANLIRQTCQSLTLRSVASSIFERGVNAGGTVDALKRSVKLILDIAGGEVASDLYDLKENDFKPWKLKLEIARLNNILGIKIKEAEVFSILDRLNLSPKKISKNQIETTIPTYRNDLKEDVDLIEEVARLYGYNKFPKTMPGGEIPLKTVPYFKDYNIDLKVKEILTAGGFSEIYTYSLISEKDLLENKINPQNSLRVDNPVSIEFEYLRPTLKPNILKAVRQNKPYFKNINLFELGKVYSGNSIDKAREEYFLSGISTNKSFSEVKGIFERMFLDLGIKDPIEFIEVLDEGIFFELNFSQLLPKINLNKKYKPIPKYPSVIEDISIVVNESVKTGKIIEEIKKQSSLIIDVSLLDQFENSRTFHIIYQHKEKNLTNEGVSKIREKIIISLKEKFKATLK